MKKKVDPTRIYDLGNILGLFLRQSTRCFDDILEPGRYDVQIKFEFDGENIFFKPAIFSRVKD